MVTAGLTYLISISLNSCDDSSWCIETFSYFIYRYIIIIPLLTGLTNGTYVRRKSLHQKDKDKRITPLKWRSKRVFQFEWAGLCEPNPRNNFGQNPCFGISIRQIHSTIFHSEETYYNQVGSYFRDMITRWGEGEVKTMLNNHFYHN